MSVRGVGAHCASLLASLEFGQLKTKAAHNTNSFSHAAFYFPAIHFHVLVHRPHNIHVHTHTPKEESIERNGEFHRVLCLYFLFLSFFQFHFGLSATWNYVHVKAENYQHGDVNWFVFGDEAHERRKKNHTKPEWYSWLANKNGHYSHTILAMKFKCIQHSTFGIVELRIHGLRCECGGTAECATKLT